MKIIKKWQVCWSVDCTQHKVIPTELLGIQNLSALYKLDLGDVIWACGCFHTTELDNFGPQHSYTGGLSSSDSMNKELVA